MFRGHGDQLIDVAGRDPGRRAGPDADPVWALLFAWAGSLADAVAADQRTQHVAVFIPDESAGGLRLAAQIWGAGEDTGEVVVGAWVVPFDGSVTGRVHRTGMASLSADVSLDPDYRPYPGGRTRSSLTVPVRGPRGVLAVINVEAPWPSAFTIGDYERMTAHAAAASATWPLADEVEERAG